MKAVLTSGLLAKAIVCATFCLVLVFTALCVYPPVAFMRYLPHRHPSTTPNDGDDTMAVYNITSAWRALHFCKTAYCPVAKVTNWSCGNACTNATADFKVFNVYNNESTGNAGFSGLDHEYKNIVVAFRGTFNTANWIQDLKFWSIPYPNPACGKLCTIHRGFYYAYASMREQLIEDVLLMYAQHPTYSLFITGHSLGGAMAVLCAIEFTTWNFSVITTTTTATDAPAFGEDGAVVHHGPALPMRVELYTFGEPRLGNVYFTNWSTTVLSGGRQFRVTHARDPVPHLPPRSSGYVHVPQEHWYPANNGTYMLCADSSDDEDPACSNSVYSTTVSDHLAYLGTCTRCECTQAVMEEIGNYTLSPEMKAILGMEYLIDHPDVELTDLE